MPKITHKLFFFFRRGRGRGGSRGGGRSIDDSQGRVSSSGGRGQGSYHPSERGPYRGSVSESSQGNPIPVAKPPPEFEMKGNDFPALPGASSSVEVSAQRKVNNEGASSSSSSQGDKKESANVNSKEGIGSSQRVASPKGNVSSGSGQGGTTSGAGNQGADATPWEKNR